jgi:predicted transcriptional regulator
MRPKQTKQPLELTRAELEVMQHIWRLGEAYLGEVVDQFVEPRPAYTTISTVIRTLEAKGFVTHRVVGKSHRYSPAVTKEEYRAGFMKRVVSNFFNDSPGEVLSFLAWESGSLSVGQYEELRRVARQIVEAERNKEA